MAGIDANTKLLLHCNGADASTTFTDSATSPNTCTANGNAQIDTDQSKFGGASGKLDGAGDFVNIPDAAWMDFGTGDFTVDFWVRIDVIGTWTYFMDDTNSGGRIQMRYRAGFGLETFIAATNTTFAWTASEDTWYHVALTRSSGTARAFIDGTQIGTDLTRNGDITHTVALQMGSNNTLDMVNGWMDEFRISNVARWTANFTPPSAEYSADSAKIRNMMLLGMG